MNKVVEIYRSLTDNEVKELVQEMSECDVTGHFTENSKIRELCKTVAKVTGLDVSSNLLMTQMAVYKEAANRWLFEQEMKDLDRDDLEIKTKE